MSGTYITIKWYGSDTARSHLMHDNRTRSTIRDPHIERYGSITDEDLLARVVGRTKPITNRYLETMAYTQGTVQLEEVKSYLEQKLARPVVAYRHLDEAVEHCHFLAPNAGTDGRALRLNLSDFSEIKQRIAGILGRTVSPRGAAGAYLPGDPYR